jgi:hypothetical protein
MCGDKTARLIIKRGSGVPTIPVSADHRNGDWLVTDIYEGEQYLDTDTGITYTRNGSSIEAVGGGAGEIQPKVWKAQILQESTDAPVLNVLVNTLDVTITPTYSSVGTFFLNGFDSKLTDGTCIERNMNFQSANDFIDISRTSSSIIVIATSNSGTLSNDIIWSSRFRDNIITVTKYD